jgi:transposase
MTVSPEIEAKIKRAHFVDHWPIGTIATQLGVHRDVVRRVLGIDARNAAARARPPSRPSDVDPFIAFIRATLAEHPTLVSTRLFDMIKDRGYTGSPRRLREVVRAHRPPKPRETFAHLDFIAGEQSQIDWAHLGKIQVRGAQRDLWLFVLTLSWSRAFWAELVLDLGVASLRRSLVRAAGFFGGVTRQWLFDNPKTVVVERDRDKVRFQTDLLDLCSYYHVEPRVCVPRKANQKGRVERMIRYLRERHFAARTISNIADGNKQLLVFIDQIANARPHPDQQGRTVGDMLVEEQGRLLALPEHPMSTDQVLVAPLDKYGYVSFDRNRYAVPNPSSSTVTLSVSESEVRILDGLFDVIRHPRSYGRRERIGRVLSTIVQKPATVEHSVRAQLRASAPQIDVLYTRWLDLGLNLGSMTARVNRIAQLYSAGCFREAVEVMVAQKLADPGALESICDRLRRAKNTRAPVQLNLGPHVPDRDVELTRLEVFDER